MHPVDGARSPPAGQRLELELDLSDSGRVEQLAQLVGPEQLCEQLAVQCQGLRSTLGEWRVSLVHVGPDIVEEE